VLRLVKAIFCKLGTYRFASIDVVSEIKGCCFMILGELESLEHRIKVTNENLKSLDKKLTDVQKKRKKAQVITILFVRF